MNADFEKYFLLPYNVTLPTEQINFLAQNLKEYYLKENKKFINKDAVESRTFFLVKGLVKEFEEKNNEPKAIITNFITPGHLISFLPSHLSDGIAWCNLETVTETKLYYLKKEALLYMLDNYEELSHMYLSHTANLLKFCVNRLRYLLCNNSKERYKKFAEDFSEYHSFIPQTEIASYLNLTPETISRLKNETIQSA